MRWNQNPEDDDRRDECAICRRRGRHEWNCPELREDDSEAERMAANADRRPWQDADR